MNFSINLGNIGVIPMTNIIVIGLFVLLAIAINRLPDIIKAVKSIDKTAD